MDELVREADEVNTFQPSDWELFIGRGADLPQALDSEEWISMDVPSCPEELVLEP